MITNNTNNIQAQKLSPLALAAFISISALFPAAAGPREDAQTIAALTITEDIFRGALRSQRDIIGSAIQNDLRKEGIDLKEPGVFLDAFVEAFIAEFTIGMQQEAVTMYLAEFNEAELSGIATFYQTDAGAALLKKSPRLMALGAEHGAVVGERAGRNAAPRLARILEDADVLAPIDRSMKDRLIDMLR